MINNNDKDGTIEFLKERIRKIRDEVQKIYTVKNVYVYDYEDDDYYEVNHEMNTLRGAEDIDSVVDLCDKTLMEVTF